MGDRTDRAPGPRPEASTAVLFSGSMDTNPSGLRIRATSHLRNLSAAWGFPGETFYRFFYGPTFEEELPRALLVASPRGWGRSSFRSSELIQMGLAQLYIWDDTPWLPYWHPDPSRRRGRQEFWGPNGIGLALHVDSLGDLRRVLCAMLTPEGGESPCAPDPGIGADGQPPPAPFLKAPYAVGPTTLLARMRARAAAFAPSHFTYKGVMDRITEFMVTPWDADLVCRPYPRSVSRLRGVNGAVAGWSIRVPRCPAEKQLLSAVLRGGPGRASGVFQRSRWLTSSGRRARLATSDTLNTVCLLGSEFERKTRLRHHGARGRLRPHDHGLLARGKSQEQPSCSCPAGTPAVFFHRAGYTKSSTRSRRRRRLG